MKLSKWKPLLLLAPLLLILGMFLAGLAHGILQGFGYIPEFGMTEFSLDYFRSVFSDHQLLYSVAISLYIASVSASATTALAVLLTYAVVTLKKEHGFLYAVFRFPMYIPWVVTGLLMIHLFSGGGWLSRFFSALGLTGMAAAMSDVLHSPSQAGIIIAFVWASTPFASYLILSVMASIKDTLGEAAANLGAGFWQRFWNIMLPLSFPVIRSTFLIVFLSCFGSYEIPVLLGMTRPRALPVEVYYLYSQQNLTLRPHAMALNTVMLLISLLLAGLILLFPDRLRKGDAP
ncbi:Binding-protein-dependent transport system inner membrane component [anaerobic digester metagenome]